MERKESCQNCYFCETDRCHRQPPVKDYCEGIGEISCFPKVHRFDWCGEFKPKENVVETNDGQ